MCKSSEIEHAICSGERTLAEISYFYRAERPGRFLWTVGRHSSGLPPPPPPPDGPLWSTDHLRKGTKKKKERKLIEKRTRSNEGCHLSEVIVEFEPEFFTFYLFCLNYFLIAKVHYSARTCGNDHGSALPSIGPILAAVQIKNAGVFFEPLFSRLQNLFSQGLPT